MAEAMLYVSPGVARLVSGSTGQTTVYLEQLGTSTAVYVRTPAGIAERLVPVHFDQVVEVVKALTPSARTHRQYL